MMNRKNLCVVIAAFLIAGLTVNHGVSQDKIPESPILSERGKALDRQIAETNKRIVDLVIRTDLLNSEIRILPHQSSYNNSANTIEIETHNFMRDDIYNNKIIGINKRTVKIHTDGKTVSKIETTLYENNHMNGNTTVVQIVDPSPMSGSTENITFTHIINARGKTDAEGNVSYTGKVLLENRKLGEIRNHDASPLRNQIKNEFILPHLVNLYNNVLFITQAYMNSRGDSDGYMAEFIKESLKK